MTYALMELQLQYTVETYDPTCATFVDGQTCITGSSDGAVNSWRIQRPGQGIRPRQMRQMQAHTQGVLCVAASKSWSIVVSGSGEKADGLGGNVGGTGAVWDLKRGVHVWSARHSSSVGLCAIMESTVSRHVLGLNWLLTQVDRGMLPHVPPHRFSYIPLMATSSQS